MEKTSSERTSSSLSPATASPSFLPDTLPKARRQGAAPSCATTWSNASSRPHSWLLFFTPTRRVCAPEGLRSPKAAARRQGQHRPAAAGIQPDDTSRGLAIPHELPTTWSWPLGAVTR